MSSPTYETTTVKQLVARIKVRLQIEHTNTFDLFLKDCVIEAAKEMSTKQDFVERTAVLEITEDFTVVLPSDFFDFDRGNTINSPIVFTEDGRAVENASQPYTNPIFTNDPFVTCSPYDTTENALTTMNIQNGILYLSNNVKARQCKISYLAVNRDEAGNVIIPSNNARAIMNYAMSEWGLANGLPSGVVQEYRRIWTQGKLEARGKSKLLGTQERERLYRIMNS